MGYSPNKKDNGRKNISKTPGISQIKITARKHPRIFTAITDLISLYLLKMPRAPYTIRVYRVCIGQM